jgi:hypothetical protein
MGKFAAKRIGGVFAFCVLIAIASHAQTLTTLFTFDGTNGTYPSGLTQGFDGNMLGVTNRGGLYGDGTVWKGTASAFSSLYSFCAQTNCPDGQYPVSGLSLSEDGSFYGVTLAGGLQGSSRSLESNRFYGNSNNAK